MRAGVTVVESQPLPQRLPDEMAALIALVSSVEPSPLAPKSLTLRKIWKLESPYATVPWRLISDSQYEVALFAGDVDGGAGAAETMSRMLKAARKRYMVNAMMGVWYRRSQAEMRGCERVGINRAILRDW
jgi:hypothetical protein